MLSRQGDEPWVTLHARSVDGRTEADYRDPPHAVFGVPRTPARSGWRPRGTTEATRGVAPMLTGWAPRSFALMAKIIIGVDTSDRSLDAIALGAMLAQTSGGTPILLAHGYTWVAAAAYTGTPEFDRAQREESDALLAQAAASLGDDVRVETRSLPASSPARALHELAERERAGLIVIGSSHVGRRGRVLPGSTGERLLHGSPCPIAVAPLGFATGAATPKVVGCAWDASPEAEAALESAAELASATRAVLRVLRVAPSAAQPASPLMGVDWDQLQHEMREEARRALADRVALLPAELRAEAVFADGEAVPGILELSGSVDLLVMGSRGYGPLRAVVVGGVAGAVIRGAACPVVIVPRGVRLDLPAPGEVRATATT